MEDYLINLHDFESRKLVAKFWCSDHVLKIETGRHKKLMQKYGGRFWSK